MTPKAWRSTILLALPFWIALGFLLWLVTQP